MNEKKQKRKASKIAIVSFGIVQSAIIYMISGIVGQNELSAWLMIGSSVVLVTCCIVVLGLELLDAIQSMRNEYIIAKNAKQTKTYKSEGEPYEKSHTKD